MNEIDKYCESLSDKEIEEMIKNLKGIQNKREASYIQIMLDRNGPALDAYLKDHDFKLSVGMLDNFTINNFSDKDIPFYEALKKSSQWEKLTTTSHIKEILYCALKYGNSLDYFINNEKEMLRNYIMNSLSEDAFPHENIKKLYQSNILNVEDSEIKDYLVRGFNESVVMYGISNNLVELNQEDIKIILTKRCPSYDISNVEVLRQKLSRDFVFNLKDVLKNLVTDYPNPEDSINEAYYNLTLIKDTNFEYLVNNSVMNSQDVEKILQNLEEAFPLRHSKVKLLSQAVFSDEVLTKTFMDFRRKINNDNFINTFDNAVLYLKLHKDLDDKKVANKLKI